MSILVAVITYVSSALLVGYVGKLRKLGFWGYFLISMFLSPFAGLLTIFVEDKIAERKSVQVVRPVEPVA
jgi:hypothetical protein